MIISWLWANWLGKWSPITIASMILSSDIIQVFPQMINSFHDRWWRQVFPNKLFRRIHGSIGHLKQTLCCMNAWNDSRDQNSKTLKDVKNLRKIDGCPKNGIEDRRKNVWVGGSSPFFVDNDLLTTLEFELLLQKHEEILEHYGS